MNADLISKMTGKIVHVDGNTIHLAAPDVVRLDLDRSQVANLERQGNDLLIHLINGEIVRVENFYVQANGISSSLVLQGADHALWLADTTEVAGPVHFLAIKDLAALGVEESAAGGGGASLLPILLGIAGAGGLAAAVAGGGGSKGSSSAIHDTTPPSAPSATFNADGTSVFGTGEAGAQIQIKDANGAVIGSGTVASNGEYSVSLIHPDVNSEHVTVTQTDQAGNVSAPATAIAPDLTAPPVPAAEINAQGTVVTGSGEAGDSITVKDATGTVIGTGTVGADGHYSVTLDSAHVDGASITVTETDPAGNVSPAASVATPDLIAPGEPSAAVSADGTTISGVGEPGATVTVTDSSGHDVATATVGADGHYSAPLPAGEADGGTLTVTQTDPAGNVSHGVSVTTPDLVAPDAPTATVAADGLSVSGTGEAGDTIFVHAPNGTTLGIGTVGADGTYTVILSAPQDNGQHLQITQTDQAGNVSNPTEAISPDTTEPTGLTADIDPTGAIVSGTGEPGAAVVVHDASGTTIATGMIAQDGTYTVSLTPHEVNGETLRVTQSDAAGNVSAPVNVVAPDITPPAGLTAEIDGVGAVITGHGEPGATIAVHDVAGAAIGTAVVASDGTYTVSLAVTEDNGEHLTVTQADPAGNVSPQVTVTAPDLTAPLAPTGAVSGDGTTVTGTGEAGAVLVVHNAMGGAIGTVTVGADGTYSVTLSPPQADGQVLELTQKDAAGNVSAPTDIVAPDITAPVGLTAAVAATGDMVVGVGAPGATVTVRDPDGHVIGSARVDGQGNYTVLLSVVEGNGQILHVTQQDASGNAGAPVNATAPDFTAPVAPSATVASDGHGVTGIGEPGATVTIHDASGAVLGTAVVAANGSYSVTLATPQVNGEHLTAVETDAAGNVSPSVTALAPDITAPNGPTATVSADGLVVSGSGEAGATITVRDASGAIIGTALVAGNGSYVASLSTAETNGQILHVTQSDAAHNISPEALAVAPDSTAPAAPVLTIAPDGTVASGTGEAGATVTVMDASGAVIGTATVAGDGSYSAVLTTPQANGQTLSATETDHAGNISAPTIATAPDITPPAAPVAGFDATGSIVSGTGEPGAVVSIRDGTQVVGTGTVDAQGHFLVSLATPEIDRQVLSVTLTDTAHNASPATLIAAPDLTAPPAPAGTLAGDGATLSGTGEAGAVVHVFDPVGAQIGTAVVATDGTFTATLTPPQTDGQIVDFRQTDAAGNVSPDATAVAPDLIPTPAPDAPTATISHDGTTVTGSGVAGDTITVHGADGTVLGTVVVGVGGTYTATLSPPQTNGETLHVTQAAGALVSQPTTVTAFDTTAPAAPAAVIDPTGHVVSGTGEAGATVHVTDASGTVVGTAVVGANGSYSAVLTTPENNGQTLNVTQADTAGNVSPSTVVAAPDLTAPVAPTVHISADGSVVTGIGEPGAHITITEASGAVIGTAIVAGDGSYSATLATPQVNGEHLAAVEADAAGNLSPSVGIVAPDITAPLAPAATIDPTGTMVTGTGEPRATVVVHDASGTTIGTAVVAADGSYTAVLGAAQLNGQTLSVTEADGAGNVSPATSATAPDVTAPALPTAIVGADGTTVSGTGEAGATVHITDSTGAVVGTAIVAGDGSYHATLSVPQANGQTLDVSQSDAAGNVSPTAIVHAPDITPPDAPSAVAINHDGTIVTGQGEAGATAEVHTADGTLIGTATVGVNGSFAVTLTQAETAGEMLTVSQHDPAGNESSAASIVAPFDITAFDNAANASIDLAPTSTNEALGAANYLALVSLGLLNLDAQVLATPNVQFTVQAGHTLNATFTYDALVSIGVLSDYTVVIQKFDGTNWVSLDGTGNSSILDLHLLDGNLVSNEALGAGEYRAFVTFNGALGVGLLGGLNVSGVDNDYTHIASISPATTTGNVITDPGTGGQIDVAGPQTHVSSVQVDGMTTVVTADHTVIAGDWGVLTINLDGSYSYVPNADAAAIGKTDTFTYTLTDGVNGDTASAELSLSIGSPDISGAPVAVNDSAIATANFAHPVTTIPAAVDASFNTPTAIILNGPQTGSASHTFTIGSNSTANVTLSAIQQAGLSVLPTYTITVFDSQNHVVGTVTQAALAGLPLGSGVSLTLPDLAAGTYHYTVSSTNVLGTGYGTSVYLGETVTHLDQYSPPSVTSIDGHLLDNDTTGSAFATLRVETGGHFVDVGNTPVQIAGAYGTLNIDAAGDYHYQPNANLAYSNTDPVDSFVYQIVQPNGTVATAQLNVTVDVNNGVAPASVSPLVAMQAVTNNMGHVSLTALSTESSGGGATGSPSGAHASALLTTGDSNSSVAAMLSRFLGEPHSVSTTQSTATVSAAHASTELTSAAGPPDPLGYLAPANDSEHERLAHLHTV